jgi:hypothetical protein
MRDQVRNDDIRDKVGIVQIEESWSNTIWWFGHVQRSLLEALVHNEILSCLKTQEKAEVD